MQSVGPRHGSDVLGNEGDHYNEALVATEQLAYLISELNAKRARLASSINSYLSLVSTLTSVHQRTRSEVMVPVANGMGYFQGCLRHTNDVLVLLGDNWFAERTVAQAEDVCNRRLVFLRKEDSLAAAELAELETKQRFLEHEFPAQEQQRLSAHRDARPTALQPTTVASSGGDDENAEDDLLDFHPDDELTDDELDALEKSLDPRLLTDDAYVEQCMLDLMMAKRAARLSAVFGDDGEDEQRSATTSKKKGRDGITNSQGVAPPPSKNDPAPPSAKPSVPAVFVSPADIGPPQVNGGGIPSPPSVGQRRTVTFTLPHNSLEAPRKKSSSPHSSSSSSVLFAGGWNTTGDPLPIVPDSPSQEAFDATELESPAGSTVAPDAPGASGGERQSVSAQHPAGGQQRTFHPLGSVAERRVVGSQRVVVDQPPPSISGGGGTSDRAATGPSTHAGRSLFMRRMLGEGR